MTHKELNGIPLSRLIELAEAEKEGRIKILPAAESSTCGSCKHFHRETGKRSGGCDLREHTRDRYGREEKWKFQPSQSRKACKQYEEAK